MTLRYSLRSYTPVVGLLPVLWMMGAAAAPAPARPFAIEVVDAQTGRGVPLVELRTMHAVAFFTDSHGIAAIAEPGFAGRQIHFQVRSHGYEFPADGFGIRGVALKVEPGKTARLKINRLNVAERLYRVTGEGIYRDSLLVGRPAPVKQPLLNAQVVGCDSVQNVVYGGKLFWMWGDTSRTSYPLGNFHMSGATSALPGKGGLDPSRGVDLHYFTAPSGFAREMAPVPGEGPTWLGGLVTLPEGGRERLFADYSKIRNVLEVYERGLVRFEDGKGQFERIERFPLDAPIQPFGHTTRRRVDGADYVYFGDPFPLVRVRADATALRDLSQYEAYTCLREGSRLASPALDRVPGGALRYAWRRGTPALGAEDQEKLIRQGKLRRDEALLRLQDYETGKPFVAHRGTVCWNAHRRRWIMIATEIGGSSQVGEVWYAEAPAPLGPWKYARKVITHDRYSFYNPAQHPEFDQQGGRLVYFEGTYTHSFSGNPEQTPRYDYNQMMYRLDLADPRLTLPAPVYAAESGELSFQPGAAAGDAGGEAAFCALERPAPGSVPRYWREGRLWSEGVGAPAFYVLPAATLNPPPETVPLYEWTRARDGARRYSTDPEPFHPEFQRAPIPDCRVWRR